MENLSKICNISREVYSFFMFYCWFLLCILFISDYAIQTFNGILFSCMIYIHFSSAMAVDFLTCAWTLRNWKSIKNVFLRMVKQFFYYHIFFGMFIFTLMISRNAYLRNWWRQDDKKNTDVLPTTNRKTIISFFDLGYHYYWIVWHLLHIITWNSDTQLQNG